MTYFQGMPWLIAGMLIMGIPVLIRDIWESRRLKSRPEPPPVDPVELRRVSNELERLSGAIATMAAGQESAAKERVGASA